MKLIDAINKVDRSPKNTHNSCISEFCDALEITDSLGWSDVFSKRVKQHYLIKWYCTDTWVGTCVYYMDDKPIAVSTQFARKSDTNYHFISEEAADKVLTFIRSLEKEDRVHHQRSLIEEDQEIDDTYSVGFSGQLLTKVGAFNGRKCTVVKEVKDGYISKRIIISFDDDHTTQEIDVGDFKINLHLEEKP